MINCSMFSSQKNGQQLGSILLIGDDRVTLTVSRSFSRMGYRVILGSSSKSSLCGSSRYVDEVWKIPPLKEEGQKGLITRLIDYLEVRKDIFAVFPIGETEINAFLHKEADLPKRIQVISVDSETASLCLDKAKLLSKVTELGIPCSSSYVVNSYEELCDAQRKLEFPCVVKPVTNNYAHMAEKAVILEEPKSLEYFTRWPTPGASLLIQKYFKGCRHNLYFAANKGEIISLVEVKILLTDVANDTGLAVWGKSVAPTEKLERYTRKLVKSLGYHGVGCAQYLYDEETSECSFLELNPRLGANLAITQHCGVDFSKLFFQLTENPTSSKIKVNDYVKDIHYVWLTGALAGITKSIETGQCTVYQSVKSLLKALRLCLTCRSHIVWHTSDPVPATILLMKSLKYYAGAVGRKLLRMTPRV